MRHKSQAHPQFGRILFEVAFISQFSYILTICFFKFLQFHKIYKHFQFSCIFTIDFFIFPALSQDISSIFLFLHVFGEMGIMLLQKEFEPIIRIIESPLEPTVLQGAAAVYHIGISYLTINGVSKGQVAQAYRYGAACLCLAER